MIGRRDNRYEEIVQEFDKFFRKVQEMYKNQQTPEVPLVFGYTYLRGADGEPHLSRFGSLLEDAAIAEGLCEPPARAVLHGKDGPVSLELDMPGAEKKSIHIMANDGTLAIEAFADGRKFQKHLDLPADLVAESAKATYDDGVLRVTLERAKVEKLGYEIAVS